MRRQTFKSRIAPSEITPPEVYFNRRTIIAAAIAGAASALLPPVEAFPQAAAEAKDAKKDAKKYPRNPKYSVNDKLTDYEDITSYNNFYEFGTDKGDPKQNSRDFKPTPWSVTVDGEAEVTGTFTLEDILKPHAIEERVYRLRCVERWSMVIPWLGFPLPDLLKRFKPTSKAKFVEFTTLHDPKRMPGQRYPVLRWPYVEGLRIDEAMHPLAFMVTGLYGRNLPNQNGAPLRLAVPWKYGFKSGKSIVRIRFTEKQPMNSWYVAQPDEYGFYSNVNPNRDHPRWSQKKERVIGAGVFEKLRDTEMFNGYAEEVASLYKGMDLLRYY